jgi:hypothetical protein
MVIWDGVKVHQAFPMAGDNVNLNDVNAYGIAVGESVFADDFGDTRPWIYRDGQLTRLMGARARPAAINDAGVIVGEAGGQPVMWKSFASGPETLPLPAGARHGWVVDIREDGLIVGMVSARPREAGSPDTRVVTWVNGQLDRELQPPAVAGPSFTFSRASQVRGDWVLGAAYSNRDINLLWDLRTGQAREIGNDVAVTNRLGWTIGRTEPVLIDGSQLKPYSEVGGSSSAIVVLADDGTSMAGSMSVDGTARQGFRWECSWHGAR